MNQINALLSVAASQLGVEEEPKGSNCIKYNTDYYGKVVSGSAYPWCMVFVWWCFRKAGLSALFYDGNKTASCTTLMRWAKANGQFVVAGYKPGDVLLYQFDQDDAADHTGICIDAHGDYVVAIEGNTNDKVAQVERRTYTLHGAWRPRYDDEEQSGCGLTLPELRFGSTGASVQSMQILLEGNGYSCGRYGCDGEFGKDTLSALQSYQQYHGLVNDGVCGTLTWARLLGV